MSGQICLDAELCSPLMKKRVWRCVPLYWMAGNLEGIRHCWWI